MAEHRNVERIRRAYAAFSARDLPTVLEMMAPDCIVHAGGNGPLSGDHKGPDAIAALLTGALHLTGGTQTIDVTSIFADDHHGVVLAHETATRAADGVTLDIAEVNLVRFGPDGLITDFWDIPEDHGVHDAFYDGR